MLIGILPSFVSFVQVLEEELFPSELATPNGCSMERQTCPTFLEIEFHNFLPLTFPEPSAPFPTCFSNFVGLNSDTMQQKCSKLNIILSLPLEEDLEFVPPFSETLLLDELES